ncbi:MAG: SIMPL domain-containing protein [Sphingomonadaceae bacterium]
MEARAGVMVAGGLVALGLVLAGLAVGQGVAKVRQDVPTVTVRGVAERDVLADLATWTIATQTNGNDLASVQARADRDAETIRTFLQKNGFSPAEISVRGSGVSQWYDGSRGVLNISLRQRFQARTNDIARMQQAFASQAEIIRAGVALDSDGAGGLTYSFTRLNDVKPEMIAEATRAAREAADQFAADSGTKVGGIQTATQGLFTITGRDGDLGPGTDTPDQKVRVVTTVTFRLED